jgi:hypothetical protein
VLKSILSVSERKIKLKIKKYSRKDKDKIKMTNKKEKRKNDSLVSNFDRVEVPLPGWRVPSAGRKFP